MGDHRPSRLGIKMNSAEIKYTSATVGILAAISSIILSGIDPYLLMAAGITTTGLYALTAAIRDN